ncbi:hypothetical protein D3C71_1031170 [compost metagenome]
MAAFLRVGDVAAAFDTHFGIAHIVAGGGIQHATTQRTTADVLHGGGVRLLSEHVRRNAKRSKDGADQRRFLQFEHGSVPESVGAPHTAEVPPCKRRNDTSGQLQKLYVLPLHAVTCEAAFALVLFRAWRFNRHTHACCRDVLHRCA